MGLKYLVVTVVDGFPSFKDGLPYNVVEGGAPRQEELVGPYAPDCGPILLAGQKARLIGSGSDGRYLWLVNNLGEQLPSGRFNLQMYRVLENWSKEVHWETEKYMWLAREAARELGFDGIRKVDPSSDALEHEKAS